MLTHARFSSLETGFVFLGIYFHGQQRRIADAKIQQMQAEIRHFWQRYAQAPVPQLIDKLNESILGWKRYYGMVQPVEQFQALDGYIAEGLARALALRLTRGDLERNADLSSLLTELAFLCDLSEPWKEGLTGAHCASCQRPACRQARRTAVSKHRPAPVNGQTCQPWRRHAPTSTAPAPPATVSLPSATTARSSR